MVFGQNLILPKTWCTHSNGRGSRVHTVKSGALIVMDGAIGYTTAKSGALIAMDGVIGYTTAKSGALIAMDGVIGYTTVESGQATTYLHMLKCTHSMD